MLRRKEGEFTDENVGLLSRGFYVEPLNYKMDVNKIPENGSEYIHLVRLEESKLFSKANQDISASKLLQHHNSPGSNASLSLSQWKRKEADFFCHLVTKLRSSKVRLSSKYEKKKTPPIQCEEDWCHFILGPDGCKQIYGDQIAKDFSKNPPYLSIVLHLNQEEICVLLSFIRKWVLVIGMTDDLCKWAYSLMACLVKPLSEDCQDLLEDMLDDFSKKSKTERSNLEKKQLHLIIAILKIYFSIELHSIIPILEKFMTLA